MIVDRRASRSRSRPRRGSRCRAAVAALVGLAACVGTERPAPPMPYVPFEVRELERYQIRADGEVVGTARYLEIVDPAGPLRFWRFENRNGAWLGHADDHGRFSRRVPFRDDEEDLGIWPMQQGIGELIEARGPIDLRRVAVPEAASSPRGAARPIEAVR